MSAETRDEQMRREMIETGQPERDLAEATQRWSSHRMAAEFTVISFAAPFVMVRRKSDGMLGTLEFTHLPRWYFNFVPD